MNNKYIFDIRLFVDVILFILFVYQIKLLFTRMKFGFFISLFIMLSMQLIAQDNWNRDDFILSIKEDINRSTSVEYRRVGNRFLTNFIEHTFNNEQEALIFYLVTALRDMRYNDAEDFHDLYKLLNHYGLGQINEMCFNTFLSSSLYRTSL